MPGSDSLQAEPEKSGVWLLALSEPDPAWPHLPLPGPARSEACLLKLPAPDFVPAMSEASLLLPAPHLTGSELSEAFLPPPGSEESEASRRHHLLPCSVPVCSAVWRFHSDSEKAAVLPLRLSVPDSGRTEALLLLTPTPDLAFQYFGSGQVLLFPNRPESFPGLRPVPAPAAELWGGLASAGNFEAGKLLQSSFWAPHPEMLLRPSA